VSAPGATVGAAPSLTEFFDGARAGRLVVQRCARCGEPAVPPKALCPACHAGEWTRLPLAGEGEVASFTVIRVPPGRLAADAPYAIVVVRFPEAVSLLGRTRDVPLEALRVGLPVRFAGTADPAAHPPVILFGPRP
jgi:uncharacterized OB-fold protein